VLHHPLNTGEINANPRGQSVLINPWRIMKRGKNRRLTWGQPLGFGHSHQRRGENSVEAPPQVELVVTMNRWKGSRQETAGGTDRVGADRHTQILDDL
jgi:hypothetical protein